MPIYAYVIRWLIAGLLKRIRQVLLESYAIGSSSFEVDVVFRIGFTQGYKGPLPPKVVHVVKSDII